GRPPPPERIAERLLDPSRRPAPMTEALLMEAARADLVANAIRPAIAAGRIVLCDRYADSTLAYQGGGRGLDVELLRALNRAATGGLAPDLTLLIDLHPATGLQRRAPALTPVDRPHPPPPALPPT